jgi:hypothetical protein
MSSKKRSSYRGTPAEHRRDAATYAKRVRENAKRVVALAKGGDCIDALAELTIVSNAEGREAISRLYTKKRSAPDRSSAATHDAYLAVAKYCLR